MTKYGSPIACSFGEFSNCNCQNYYPLGNTPEEAKREALRLMRNPPSLEECGQYGAERFLDCYPGDDPREFQPGIPLVVEIRTGEIVAFTDDDF